jgi:lipopolysaccharide assembly outer membrane protein LptD (OstA)
MKRTVLAICVFVVFAATAMSQQAQRAQFAARMAGQQGHLKKIEFTADTMTKEDRTVHLMGNVEVRITSVRQSDDRTIIHANEVIYHLDTGDVETRGNGNVTFERAQQ